METPEGFLYQPAAITPQQEHDLLHAIQAQAFDEVRMRGVTAKRRVLHYGWVYGYESWQLTPGPPLPPFLADATQAAARAAGVDPAAFQEVLVTEYPGGAAIGWHCDAPMFGVVAGLSLLAPCRMRFRPIRVHQPVVTQALEPRSLYVLSGAARTRWQHSIPPVPALRYSITFRTMKADSPRANPA